MQLKRRFGPLTLLILSINGMVGSAWLFAPLYAARIAGPYAIYAWCVAGLMTAIIALTFAEVSVLFPVAGGTTEIPQLSHGALTSFMLSWVAWLSALTMPPIEVQAVLQYASIFFPSLIVEHNGVPVLTDFGYVWATVLMLSLSILNVASFKGLLRFNLGIFCFKIAIILLVVYTLISTHFEPSHFSSAAAGSIGNAWYAIFSAVSMGGIAFAFTGYKHGVELAGEAKHTKIAIPLAIIGSVICCLVIYLSLQIAFIGALDAPSLAAGWGKLNFSHDVGPFAGLLAALGVVLVLKLLYVDATLSPLGAGFVYVTSTARTLYAMSRNGYVPSFLSFVSKESFPIYAVFVNFILGMCLFLPFPGWQAMVGFLVSAMVISYAMGPIALLSLRLQLPLEQRDFRLPAVYLLSFLAFYCCNLLSYWTGWDTISKLMIALIVGFGFFGLAVLRGKISASSLGLKSIGWLFPYLGGLGLISYLGAFGHDKNWVPIIPFGWDFIVIAVFSFVTLTLAVHFRVSVIAKDRVVALQLQTVAGV